MKNQARVAIVRSIFKKAETSTVATAMDPESFVITQFGSQCRFQEFRTRKGLQVKQPSILAKLGDFSLGNHKSLLRRSQQLSNTVLSILARSK
jgi:hypothetical protein